MISRRVNGFSIIEVLVASFILFSAIATLSAILTNSLLNLKKIEKNTIETSEIASVRAFVTNEIAKKKYTGEAKRNHIKFTWQTSKIAEGAKFNYPRTAEIGSLYSNHFTLALHQIHVNYYIMQSNIENSDINPKSFEFTEVFFDEK
jgi:type II secretory pathway component PulJ